MVIETRLIVIRSTSLFPNRLASHTTTGMPFLFFVQEMEDRRTMLHVVWHVLGQGCAIVPEWDANERQPRLRNKATCPLPREFPSLIVVLLY